MFLSRQIIFSAREKCWPYPSREFISQGKNVGPILRETLFPQGKNFRIPADNFFPKRKMLAISQQRIHSPMGKCCPENLFPQGKNVPIPAENISPEGVLPLPQQTMFPPRDFLLLSLSQWRKFSPWENQGGPV